MTLTTTTPDLVPVSMLAAYAYCPRLAHFQWIHGEREDNADIVHGRLVHRRVDRKAESLPSPNENAGEGETASDDDLLAEEHAERHAGEPSAAHTTMKPVAVRRSVDLTAPKLGLVTRLDYVELRDDHARPVEYKRGGPADVEGGVHDSVRVQLCAQGLILRENGYTCDEGMVWFDETRRRVLVPFDDALIETTLVALASFRASANAETMPPPLIDSPQCPRCSMVEVCLPDEVNELTCRRGGDAPIRDMVPRRELRSPLHVVEQGAKVGIEKRVVQIKKNGKLLHKKPMREISHVSLYGGVQISTQARGRLVNEGIDIATFSFGGWFATITHGMPKKNIDLRVRQFAAAADPQLALAVARPIVAAKIANTRTLLRRKADDVDSAVLEELRRLSRSAEQVDSLPSLLGIEGAAARAYFSRFASMIRRADTSDFDFRHRNRRPPADPVNALLSFAYSCLARQLTSTLLTVGFDPMLGLYHQPKFGRPSLALDLAEEFRPVLADSTVLTVINNGEIRPGHFTGNESIGVNLNKDGRKKFLAAWERRLSDEITHPIFEYKMSYRRLLWMQSRLLARHLSGDMDAYIPFRSR